MEIQEQTIPCADDIQLKIGGPENGQPQYLTLHAVASKDGAIISRWKPTPEELTWLQNGASIFLSIYTFGRPYPPTKLEVINVEPETIKEYYKENPESYGDLLRKKFQLMEKPSAEPEAKA